MERFLSEDNALQLWWDADEVLRTAWNRNCLESLQIKTISRDLCHVTSFWLLSSWVQGWEWTTKTEYRRLQLNETIPSEHSSISLLVILWTTTYLRHRIVSCILFQWTPMWPALQWASMNLSKHRPLCCTMSVRKVDILGTRNTARVLHYSQKVMLLLIKYKGFIFMPLVLLISCLACCASREGYIMLVHISLLSEISYGPLENFVYILVSFK